MVKNNWFKYDTNLSGFLEFKEAYKLEKEFCLQNNWPVESKQWFFQYFRDYDFNGDGKLSMIETACLLRQCVQDKQAEIDSGLTKAKELVKNVWFNYDRDMSGFLDQNEISQML